MPVKRARRILPGVVAVHNLTGRPTGVSRQLRDAFHRAAAGERKGWERLDVVVGDDKLLRELNLRHLGVDEPTDVLAFDMSAESGGLEGEIYLSRERIFTQATAAREPVGRELVRIAVHGLLHLWGWEHQDDASLKAMTERGERYVKFD